MHVVVVLYVLKVNMKFVEVLGQQAEYAQMNFIVWNYVTILVVICNIDFINQRKLFISQNLSEPPCQSSWKRTLPCPIISMDRSIKNSNCTIIKHDYFNDVCIITCNRDCHSPRDCDGFNSEGICVMRYVTVLWEAVEK